MCSSRTDLLLELRARVLCLAAGVDPDSRVSKLGSERGMPAWCGFRDAARAEQNAWEQAEAAVVEGDKRLFKPQMFTLRLERFAERIEGAIARITDQTTAIRQELQEQRADSRSLRSELRQELVQNTNDLKHQEKSHFQWIIGTIIAMAVLLIGYILGA